MKIVKLENNNIQVQDTAGRVIKSFTPSGASLEFTQGGEAVGLFYAGSNVFDFYPTEVESTQVLPAAKVPFSGDEEDLLDLLSTSFFFDEVEGTGGANLLGYPSGSYSAFLNNIAEVNNASQHFADLLWGTFLEVKADVELEAVRVQKGATTAGAFVLGIYEVDENLAPTNLVGQSATSFNTGISGIEEIVLNEIITLKAGIYCFAYHGNATGGSIRSSIYGGFHYLATPTLPNTFTWYAVRASLVYTGTLPSVFPAFSRSERFTPSGGENRIPLMAYKIA
jgi:hypothetical protein